MSRADEIRAMRKERGTEDLNGTRMRLSVRENALDRDAWEYRFVSDEGDRVFHMQERGWEITSDRASAVKKDNAGMGAEVSAYAGTQTDGKALKQILMRIPKEIYTHDQRAKERAIDGVEAGLKSGAVSGASQGEMYGDGLRELPGG